MASYRRINTAEDVLELLRDVEEDIRRDAHQRALAARSNDAQHGSDLAAPIEGHGGQSPPPPDTTPAPMSASNTPHQLHGARFTVDELVSQLMTSGTKAIVDNLPSLVTERENEEIFNHYVVQDIILLRRSPIPELQVFELDSFLPAQAVVQFPTSLEADRAVEELKHHTILGQRLDVQLAYNVWPKDISTHALQLLDDESPRYPLGGLYLSTTDKAYIIGRPEVERLEILAERASNLTRTQQDLRLKHALAASSRSSLDDLRGPADDAEIPTSTTPADSMDIDVTSSSAFASSKPIQVQQGTRGKRRQSKNLRDKRDDESQQSGTKRVKTTSENNAPPASDIQFGSGMSKPEQSKLPQQLPSLKRNKREMGLDPYMTLEHDSAEPALPARPLADDEPKMYPFEGIPSIAAVQPSISDPARMNREGFAEGVPNISREQKHFRRERTMIASQEKLHATYKGPGSVSKTTLLPSDGEPIEVDFQPRSGLGVLEPTAVKRASPGKRLTATECWENAGEELQKHGNKRVKTSSESHELSTTISPPQPAILDTEYSSGLEDGEVDESEVCPFRDRELTRAEAQAPSPSSHRLRSERPTWVSDYRAGLVKGNTSGAPSFMGRTLHTTGTNRDHEEARHMLRSTEFEGDRYVPSHHRSWTAEKSIVHSEKEKLGLAKDLKEADKRPSSFHGFLNLPGDLQDKIFTMLLKSKDDIKLNVGWLMKFVHETTDATAPLDPGAVHPRQKRPLDVPALTTHIKASLKAVPDWPRRSPDQIPQQFSALTLSLLHASKALHDRAAKVFYGSNTFHFSNSRSCWLHLEALLATVGPKNIAHIRHIRLAAPQWHEGVARNAITGACLDSMGPVTRLAAFTAPAHDRLLDAITNCSQVLGQSGCLESLRLDAFFPDDVKRFVAGRCKDPEFHIEDDELGYHDERRSLGLQPFRRLSEALGPAHRPALVVSGGKHKDWAEVRLFRDALPAIVGEADRYGWTVDPELKEHASRREPRKPAR